ncbi:MAG: hypothetical protein AAGH60_05530 [Pseudomonadota bacterium]
MRLLDVAIVSLAVAGAAYVYDVKHQAEQLVDERAKLERGVDVLSKDVSLLEADLAALESPGRLQALVGQVGGSSSLGAVRSGHYISLADIPFREVETDAVASTESLLDVTGSIGPQVPDGAIVDTEPNEIGDLLTSLATPGEEQVFSPSQPLPLAPTESALTIDQLLERLP